MAVFYGAPCRQGAPSSTSVATNEESLYKPPIGNVVRKSFSDAQTRAAGLELAVAEVLGRYEHACNHGAQTVADVCGALGFPLALTNEVIERTSQLAGSQITKVALRREIELAFRKYFTQVGAAPPAGRETGTTPGPVAQEINHETKSARKPAHQVKEQKQHVTQEQLVLRSVVSTFGLNIPRQVADL